MKVEISKRTKKEENRVGYVFRSGSCHFEHAAVIFFLKKLSAATYELAVTTVVLDKEFSKTRLDEKTYEIDVSRIFFKC